MNVTDKHVAENRAAIRKNIQNKIKKTNKMKELQKPKKLTK